ncbi:MAG: MarR family winged helix-turn-helix transcriptional regulator [Pirellulales bacterium]|nr:MarR family winged helix-turn-helix transcriptional regulator [Pirellulales bacterium]
MDASTTPTPTTPPNDGWVELLRVLMRCGRAAQRALKAQLDDGVSISQANVLWAIRELEEREPSQLDLAYHLGLSPAQISGTVEAMRAGGLIEAHRSPRDRRRQVWRLTSEGTNALAAIDDQLSAWSADCVGRVGMDEIERLSHSIGRLEQAITAQPEGEPLATPAADPTPRRAAA